MKAKRISSPLTDAAISSLRAGDCVLISGKLLTARDNSHKRIIAALKGQRGLPFALSGQTIYYMGPTPAKPGRVIGAAGPTTSSRMDTYTVPILKAGIKCMIGKGVRSAGVRAAILKYRAVYLAVVGGAGALISKTIIKARPVAYVDLGAEAVYELQVVDLPAVVVNDIYGGDIYQQGRSKYRGQPSP